MQTSLRRNFIFYCPSFLLIISEDCLSCFEYHLGDSGIIRNDITNKPYNSSRHNNKNVFLTELFAFRLLQLPYHNSKGVKVGFGFRLPSAPKQKLQSKRGNCSEINLELKELEKICQSLSFLGNNITSFQTKVPIFLEI